MARHGTAHGARHGARHGTARGMARHGMAWQDMDSDDREPAFAKYMAALKERKDAKKKRVRC